jgi:hypothetical protein
VPKAAEAQAEGNEEGGQLQRCEHGKQGRCTGAAGGRGGMAGRRNRQTEMWRDGTAKRNMRAAEGHQDRLGG